jgi:signal transduction histidine kinase
MAVIIGLAARQFVVRTTLQSEIRARREIEEQWSQFKLRLGVAMASMETGFLVTDRTGHVTHMNAPAELMTGWTAADACGRPLRDLLEQKTAAAALTGARAANTMPLDNPAVDRSTEIIVIARDGVRKVRDWSELALSSGTSLSDVAMVLRDRRDALQQPSMPRSWASLQHKLEAEKWRMREGNRLRSRFIANLSHDLRTPLNAIIGFGDLLHAGTVPPDSPKRSVFAGRIANSGRELLELINHVLDLSKVEAGDLEFHTAPVRLPELVTEVVHAAQAAYSNKGIAFAHDVDPSLIDLVLDRERLKQVIHTFVHSAAHLATARSGERRKDRLACASRSRLRTSTSAKRNSRSCSASFIRPSPDTTIGLRISISNCWSRGG